MTEVESGDNWSYKTCIAPVKSSPTNHHHPVFYRTDVLPVAQPTVSERETFSQLFELHNTYIHTQTHKPMVSHYRSNNVARKYAMTSRKHNSLTDNFWFCLTSLFFQRSLQVRLETPKQNLWELLKKKFLQARFPFSHLGTNSVK